MFQLKILKERIFKLYQKYTYSSFLLVLFLLTCLLIYSYMPPNMLNYGDDLTFHYRRIIALQDALIDNNFPTYIDYKAFENYGYGTKWFYPDLILIPFSILTHFTSFIFAYKSMWFVMTFLCGLFTYKLVRKIYQDSTVATLASLLFTFSSYRLQDIFQRAALGEAITFTFLPIVFYGLYEIIKGDYKKWYILAIGFSLLINTHLLSSLLTFVTLIIYVLIYFKDFIKDKKRIYYLIVSGIVSIFLSSYFIFPFLEQLHSNSFHLSNVRFNSSLLLTPYMFIKSMIFPHFLYLNEIFIPFIGVFLIICTLTRFGIKEKSENLKSADIGLIISIIYLLFSLNFMPWDIYPLKLLMVIQFPWRLFQFSTFFISISGAYYLNTYLKKKKKFNLLYLFFILIIACQIVTSGYFYRKSRNNISISLDKELPEMTIERYRDYIAFTEYFPSKLTSTQILSDKGNKLDYKDERTSISNIQRLNGEIQFDINLNSKEDVVELPIIYYKGYGAKINDKNIKIQESNRGLVEVPINESGKVFVKFSGTFLQRYSIYMNIISILILVIYIYISKRKNKLNA